MADPVMLLYADKRFSDEDVLHYVELAWEEIYELEYERVYGGWRGVHYVEEENVVYVTWQNSYGGPPLSVAIWPETGEKRLTQPRKEQIELEEANLSRLRELAELAESSNGS